MAQLAEHVMVCGPSGGGKTTYLRQHHARFDGSSIFMTTKKNERKAQISPPKRVRKSSCSYPGDIEKARAWALGRSESLQIIVDEAHNAPSFNEGDGPLDSGMREDRSKEIRYIVATQNPQNLNNKKDGYGLVQQCQFWVFVGPAKDWHVGFFNANNMGDLVQHMPTSNFEYVVVKPVAALPPEEKVVYRGRTLEEFA
jgi:hypothetical protein